MGRLVCALAWLVCASLAKGVLRSQSSIADSEDVPPEERLRALLFALTPALNARSGQIHPEASRRSRGVEMMPKMQRNNKFGKKQTRKQQGEDGFRYLNEKLKSQEETRREWILACADSELGDELGSTKAVEGGVSPQGQKYLWALIRGDKDSGDLDDFTKQKSVFITQPSCPSCQWPMTKAELEKQKDGSYGIRCGLCGTMYDEKGEVLEFLPARNPVQWAQAKLNANKDPYQKLGVLPAKTIDGMVKMRLPDGTLTELPPV
jgi:hypothetical protein